MSMVESQSESLELNRNYDEWNSESWRCMIPIPHIYVALIQVKLILFFHVIRM